MSAGSADAPCGSLAAREKHRCRVIRRTALSLAVAVLGLVTAAGAESAPTSPVTPTRQVNNDSVPLFYFNRFIMMLRTASGAVRPQERASRALALLNQTAAQRPVGKVSSKPVPEGIAILVGDTPVLGVYPEDLDSITGGTLQAAAAAVVGRLQDAIQAREEQRSPRFLARAAAASLVALALGAIAILGLRRLSAVVTPALGRLELRWEGRLADRYRFVFPHLHGLLMVGSRLPLVALEFAAVYLSLTYTLGRFPYTRVWSESMGRGIVTILAGLCRAVVAWLPDLLVIVVILIITRALAAILRGVFAQVATGQLRMSWCDAHAARTTSRIAVFIIWVFALVMVYPYLPGSGSQAFKGVSVFLGLLMSLGASGVVGQVVGGLLLSYGRAFRPGDLVRVGEHEGIVNEIGLLSTRIHTARQEEINVPNSLLLSTTSRNSSRLSVDSGPVVSTEVTIGYDTAWRQVEAMLLEAAARTAGVRKEPPPFVLQIGLRDSYVEYQLNVHLELARERLSTLTRLHRSILDVFNQYGVQIMSPNYESDPGRKVWVPREQWYAAPARPDAVSPTAAESVPTGAVGGRG